MILLLATGAAPFMEGGISKVTSNGLQTVDIEVSGTGTNSSVSLALPNNSVVISAKLDFLGRKYREEVTDTIAGRSAFLSSNLTGVSAGYNAAMLRSVPFLPTDQPYDFFLGYRNATAVAAGDLNGDGIPDLAACYNENAVAGFFPGRSDGSFRAFEAYPMMQLSSPAVVAVGDVDGDGLSDLVVADRGLSSFWVYDQNSTTHKLEAGALHAVGDEVDDLVVADLNSDGLLDVALCAASPCRVTVFTQNQATHDLGFFGSYALSPSGSAVSISAGDLDGDSKADIAAVTSDGTLYILSQQAGGFAAPSVFPLPSGSVGGAVAVGDINDTYAGNEVAVAFASQDLQGLQVFYQSGGSLSEGAQFTFMSGAPGQPPTALGTGDVDGDGFAEAVLGLNGNDNGALEVINRTGAVADYRLAGAARDIAINDLDGDGLKDVAAACPLGNSIAVLRQNSTGALGNMDELRFVPSAVAVGDLNNDGRDDIAVASRYCKSVGVRYMVFTGLYGTLQYAGPVNDPVALGIADLNGDGLSDLAALGRGNDSLAVFAQDPAGLMPPLYYSAGRFPSALALGDITGDGRADAVIAQSGEKYISVLSQTAGGDLAADEDYIVGLGASSMALGDFNGDGRTDLAVTVLSSNTLRVLNQTDAGKLAPPATYDVGRAPVTIAAGDIDMDHLPDIVVGCARSCSLSILLQNSSGGLDRRSDVALGSPPTGVAIGDVDRDDTPEIWLLAADGNLTLLRQDNNAGMLPPQNYSTGKGPGAFALGDLGGNGKTDIALSSTSGLFYPLEPKDFQDGNGVNFDSANNPVLACADDLNRDGLTDLLVAGSTDLLVYYRTPGGGLTLKADYGWCLGQAYNTVSGLAAGDLNGDGWDDVAVTGTYTTAASIFYGGPSGLSPTYAVYDFGTYAYCYGGMAIADVTGDGRADLIRNNYYQYVSVAAQTASGTLGGVTNYSPGIGYMNGLTVGDVNGDGRTDIVAASSWNGRVALMLRSGAGGFDTTTFATSTGYSYYNTPIVISDLNGDGRNDFAVLSYAVKKVDVFFQQEDGTISDKTSYNAYASDTIGAGIGAGDINSDGRNELVVSNSASSNLTIFSQDGQGGLYEAASYTAGVNPHGLVVTDLNSDGVPDIAVVNGGSNNISVFYQVERRGTIVPPPIHVPGGFLDNINVSWKQTPPAPDCSLKVSVSIDGVNWTAVANGATLAFTKVSQTLYRKIELTAASTYPLGLMEMGSVYVHSAFPTDPFLDVGGDGTVEWSRKGNFSTKEAIGSDILVQPLNDYLDSHRNSEGPNVNVPLVVGSASEGVIEITNISVEYDQPPYQTQPFPGDLSIDENSANNELLDLLSYFGDDYDHQLSYELVDVSNASIVNVTIVDNAWVSVDAASWNSSKNWHGEVSFRIKATDSRMLSNISDTVVVRINPVNYPPVITSTPVLNATVGELYTYMVCATDVENAPLRFILEKGLPDMELNWTTGLLRWFPRAEYLELTDLAVRIVAYDGEMYSAPQQFEVAIAPNLPPVIASTPPVSVYFSEDYHYTVNATDPENHSLAYTFMQNPDGMTIGNTNGSVAWRPTERQFGPNRVQIAVSDGYNSVIQNFEVEVLSRPAVNRLPEIISVPVLNATVNRTYTYQVLARDEDGDPLTFSAEPRPQGLNIDESSGLITWAPKYWQAGNNTVVVHVSDGKDSVPQVFVIQVKLDEVKPRPNPEPISVTTDLTWVAGAVAVLAAALFAAVLVVSARRKGVAPSARQRAAPARPAGPPGSATVAPATSKAAPVDMIAVDAGGGTVKGALPPAEEEPFVEMLAFPDAETATRLPWPETGGRRAPLKAVPPPERVAPARHAPPPEEYPQAEQWGEEPAMPELAPVPMTAAPRTTAADLARMVRSAEPAPAPPPAPAKTKEDEIDEIFRMMGVERKPAPAAPVQHPAPPQPAAQPAPRPPPAPAAQPPPTQPRPAQGAPQPQAAQQVQPIKPKPDINKTLEELMKMKK